MKQIRFKVHSICVFLMFLLMIPFGAFAQQGMVTGQVVDEKGESVIGATVQIKGTSDGTITDFDGNFSLKAKVGNTLVVSYVGYSTQEVKISKQTGNRIVLKEDAEVLDEVVVVGYGTARKGDLTGALTTMKPDANDAAKATSLDNLLSGKVAGLVVSSSSAMAGSASSITIRGASSLRGDNQPLYVIDNVPQASAGEFASSGISGDFQINQDPLASLNPSDIEDITILKDASSTAIYGSRGANGVILITTKKGKQGKAKVNVSANFTIAEPSKLLEMTNLYEHAAYINSRVSNGQYPFYVVGDEVRYVFNDALANYDPNNPATYHIINYRNWQKEIYTSAFSQNYSLSVSGGTDKTTYYISANFKDINGTVKQTGLKQGDLRANIGMDLSKSVHLNMTLSGSLRQNNMMAGGSTLGGSTTAISRTALDYAPFEMPDGDPSFSSENKTTIFSWLNDYEDIANDKTFNASMDLSWNIMKGLRYNLRVGGNLNINDRKRWYGLQLYQGMNNNGYLALTDLNKSNVSIENVLNYNTKLGSVATLDATVGVTYDDYNFLNENTNGSQFTMFDLRENGLHMAGNVQHLAPIQKDYQLLSYLGRINLTFLDKYLITASLRADGSSKFAKGNQWGVFPSAALAWRLSDEAFMKGTQDWLSNLKVRLSYGTAGNNRISSGLMYTTYTMAGNTGKAPFFDETRGAMLEHGSNLYNPNLKWETTITRNIGFDYGFFNNRLSGSLDLYWNTTKDLLMKTEIPSNTGYSYQYQNFGKTSNKGVELTLNAVLADKAKWGLNFNFNISYNRNRIDELGTENPWQSSNWSGSTIAKYEDYRVEEGGRLGEIWGYKTNGFYTAYDPVTNPNGELVLNGTSWALRDGIKDNSYSLAGGKPYPGQLKYECDENGDPIKQKLGNTVAPLTGGFGFDGFIGNFDFNIFFNYSVGNQIVNGTKLANSFCAGSAKGYNLVNDFALDNRYTWIDPETGLNLGKPDGSTVDYYGGAEGLITRLNAINTGANIYNPAAVTAMYLNDYAVEDASFLRVNNITIGYTFPKAWVKKAFMQNVRIYVTGYNLYCLTNYSGPDPEVDTSSKKNAMTPGIDYAAYPKSRSFVAGINVTF